MPSKALFFSKRQTSTIGERIRRRYRSFGWKATQQLRRVVIQEGDQSIQALDSIVIRYVHLYNIYIVLLMNSNGHNVYMRALN